MMNELWCIYVHYSCVLYDSNYLYNHHTHIQVAISLRRRCRNLQQRLIVWRSQPRRRIPPTHRRETRS